MNGFEPAVAVCIAALLVQLYRKRSILEAMLVAVVAGGSALAASEAVTWTMRRDPSSQIEDGFKEAVAKLKPTLPQQLDFVTTLVDVAYSGVVMTYHYKLDTDNNELPPDLMETARHIVTEAVCKSTMTTAMRAGAVFRYSYSDAQAKYLWSFDLKDGDCK